MTSNDPAETCDVLTEYDIAYGRLTGTVFESLANVDSLIARIPFEPSSHAGPVRNVRDPKPLDVPLQEIEAKTRQATPPRLSSQEPKRVSATTHSAELGGVQGPRTR